MATTTSKTRRTAKPRASRPANDSLAARTGRTIKGRPYTSAAIATGAVTAVAAAAAGAFFFSRRDKSFREASEELTARVRDGLSSASDKVKDLAARGSTWAGSDASKSRWVPGGKRIRQPCRAWLVKRGFLPRRGRRS